MERLCHSEISQKICSFLFISHPLQQYPYTSPNGIHIYPQTQFQFGHLYNRLPRATVAPCVDNPASRYEWFPNSLRHVLLNLLGRDVPSGAKAACEKSHRHSSPAYFIAVTLRSCGASKEVTERVLTSAHARGKRQTTGYYTRDCGRFSLSPALLWGEGRQTRDNHICFLQIFLLFFERDSASKGGREREKERERRNRQGGREKWLEADLFSGGRVEARSCSWRIIANFWRCS